ncbi:hypothetical protein ABE29_01555 [Cytobacillus firmus]|uniref:hypothetical protein n=1 Tax=Cytobacillus firmus TaxID=1399 RepID=UPI00077C4CC8|nr:hypothetical protein [Cytobacillus firmus]MBG9541534.1 hypothetical protein [Cytobacillus firmus]MBG9552203.1 hypothetical protein [Cytobacillus firmus]MBG9557274.1 hypothetical protein [Cytobacillus firmus]MBG9573390.1 hypothetical protein [Cytobacillus firmus]MEC1893764.1 hypothetical protein [Cytobacillus firmus]
MPRKAASADSREETKKDTEAPSDTPITKSEDEISKLNRMLASVLNYLSDDEVEEIDIEYLLANTEGLREWWDQYRENNKKQIEEEIKKSLGSLSLEELESIREQIKSK